MAKAACVPVVVSAWRCECRRCGHEWTVVCGCASVEAEPAPASTMLEVTHRCVRPTRCDNRKCRSRSWQTDIPRPAGRPFGTKYNHRPFAYRTGSRAWKTKVWDEDREVWVESYETYSTRSAAEAALPQEARA